MAIGETAALVSSLEMKDKGFTSTARKAEQSLGRLEAKTSTLGKVAGETQRGLGNLATNLGRIATIGVGAAVAGLALSIRSASNLEESLSKVTVVFGDSADAVIAWAATASTAFGQTKQQALEAAGTFGNLFQAFGIARPEAQEMSTSLVELAADLASFNNTSVDDALIALRSGLSGETEPLKRYGIAINDARLKTAALRLGLIRSTRDALTPAAKAAAAYALIMEDTALAQGDFARTSGGLANQQRILQAKLGDIAATIGTALLPKITELAVKFSDLLTDNLPLINEFAAKLPGIFDSVIGIVQNLPWDAIGRSLELAGTGAQALLTAFVEMPPWVQTAVLTGWGLNKLTGGALGGIVSELAKGLIRGVLGITAGVVNIRAATVIGGPTTGVPTGPTKPAPGFDPLKLLALSLKAAGLGFLIGELTGGAREPVAEVQAGAIVEALNRGISVQEATAGRSREAILQVLQDPALRAQLSDVEIGKLNDLLGDISTGIVNLPEKGERIRRIAEARQTAEIRENLLRVKDAQILSGAQIERRLQDVRGTIDAKNFSPTVRVTANITSNVAITDITRRLVSQRIAVGGTGGITIE